MEALTRFLDEFILYLQVEKNASPHTVMSYRADIERFSEFVQLQGAGEAFFMRAAPVLIRAYLAELKAEQYESSTIARKIASLRSFFRYLRREDIINDNPFSAVHTPKFAKKIPVFLDLSEINNLFKLPANDHLGRRDLAILELLYACGLRVSELVYLAIKDIDLINQYVLVYGKGPKARIIPIGCQAVEAVEQYLTCGRPQLYSRYHGKPHEILFVNKNGGPLTDRSVRRIIDKYGELSALNKKISPYTIRHTFASHLLNNGADLRVVQELLGRVNLSTTQLYNHVTKERLKVVYRHAHPRS